MQMLYFGVIEFGVFKCGTKLINKQNNNHCVDICLNYSTRREVIELCNNSLHNNKVHVKKTK